MMMKQSWINYLSLCLQVFLSLAPLGSAFTTTIVPTRIPAGNSELRIRRSFGIHPKISALKDSLSTSSSKPTPTSTAKNIPKKKSDTTKPNGSNSKNNNGTRDDIKKTNKDIPIKAKNPPQKPRAPWRASFHVSKKTQQKIQNAAETRNNGSGRSPFQRASAVLQALLSTPPQKCNAANVVCALTLSAKVMASASTTARTSSSSSSANDNFRSLLFETLDILHMLVKKKQLNSRQLCNAVWAIAKHYDRDPLLLPLMPQATAVTSEDEEQIVVAETWDLNVGTDDTAMSQAQKLDATVHQIARQLTDTLIKEENLQGTKSYDPNKSTKLGELAMASWGFGVMRPRQKPPGWQVPPQMSKLPQFARNVATEDDSKRPNDFITFEQWSLSNNDDDGSLQEEDVAPKDVTDELFDAIGEALCRPLEQENFHNASMYDPPFQLMRVSACTWNEMANLAWAFEKHGRCQSPQSEMALRALSREATSRLKSGGGGHMLSRDISQLIWALGTLQQDNFRLAHDLVELVQGFSEYMQLQNESKHTTRGRPFKEWSCPDIVQVLLSLSHARIDDAPLLLALFKEVTFRLSDGIAAHSRYQNGRKTFLAWEVSVMLWAQARLYLTGAISDVYADFTKEAVNSIHSENRENESLDRIGVGAQEQANIAWGLTVLEHYQSRESVDLLRVIFRDAASSCAENGLIQLEHAHQLWQALYIMEEESPSAVSDVPRWFRDYLQDKWNLEKSRKKISSARHRSLSQALNLMGVAHVNEHDEDIDVAIVLKDQASWTHQTEAANTDLPSGKRLAVEFDGPNHFTRQFIPRDGNPPQKVRSLGHNVLKYRLLKRQGWTVIRVPYYEFDKIPFWASMERQRYLQRLLKTHANIKFSEVDVSEYKSLTPDRKSRFD